MNVFGKSLWFLASTDLGERFYEKFYDKKLYGKNIFFRFIFGDVTEENVTIYQ